MSKVYLITGANRGLGLAALRELLSTQPEAVVYAGTRNPDAAGSEALQTLAKEDKRVRVVKLDVVNFESVKAAVKVVESESGKLDIVVANAGVNPDNDSVLKLPAEHWRQTWEANTMGVVHTFLASSDLLLKSQDPHFVVISSTLGSLTNYFDAKCAPYASSKAAVNMFVRSLDAEIPALTAYSISPGWVDTDLGRRSGEKLGGHKPPFTEEQSGKFIMDAINAATREKYGGKLVDAAADGGAAVVPY